MMEEDWEHVLADGSRSELEYWRPYKVNSVVASEHRSCDGIIGVVACEAQSCGAGACCDRESCDGATGCNKREKKVDDEAMHD